MKTLFIVSDRVINKHLGEEYDAIVDVVHEPNTDNINTYAKKIAEEIDRLAKDDDEKRIVVHIDAAPPFVVLVEDLQFVLKNRGVKIEIAGDFAVDLTRLDDESKRVLRELEKKGK